MKTDKIYVESGRHRARIVWGVGVGLKLCKHLYTVQKTFRHVIRIIYERKGIGNRKDISLPQATF
jgi:hypothetical protein